MCVCVCEQKSGVWEVGVQGMHTLVDTSAKMMYVGGLRKINTFKYDEGFWITRGIHSATNNHHHQSVRRAIKHPGPSLLGFGLCFRSPRAWWVGLETQTPHHVQVASGHSQRARPLVPRARWIRDRPCPLQHGEVPAPGSNRARPLVPRARRIRDRLRPLQHGEMPPLGSPRARLLVPRARRVRFEPCPLQ